jgi:hypothetical protein
VIINLYDRTSPTLKLRRAPHLPTLETSTRAWGRRRELGEATNEEYISSSTGKAMHHVYAWGLEGPPLAGNAVTALRDRVIE